MHNSFMAFGTTWSVLLNNSRWYFHASGSRVSYWSCEAVTLTSSFKWDEALEACRVLMLKSEDYVFAIVSVILPDPPSPGASWQKSSFVAHVHNGQDLAQSVVGANGQCHAVFQEYWSMMIAGKALMVTLPPFLLVLVKLGMPNKFCY